MGATVGGFTAPFPDTAPLADFLDQTKKVNHLLTDAVLGVSYQSAIELQEMNGVNTLFPLLSTRYPSDCGGNRPCDKWQRQHFRLPVIQDVSIHMSYFHVQPIALCEDPTHESVPGKRDLTVSG